MRREGITHYYYIQLTKMIWFVRVLTGINVAQSKIPVSRDIRLLT